MRLTFRQLDIFRAVMTAGTVTKAAELLCTSQPTVSRELARIEQVTQLCLFERHNGRLKPSESAYILYEEVKRSYLGLERIHSLVDSLRGHPSGQLSLITVPDFAQSLLPDVCARWMEAVPEAAINIAVQESPFLEQCLSSQQFDLGLTEHDQVPPGTTLRPILTMNEVCILPAGHPLLSKTVIQETDFIDQNVICFAASDPYRIHVEDVFRRMGISYHQRIETPTAMSLCRCVSKGLGIAIVNPLTALSCVGATLHIRPLAFACPFCLNLVTPAFRPASVLRDAFIDALDCEMVAIRQALAAYQIR